MMIIIGVCYSYCYSTVNCVDPQAYVTICDQLIVFSKHMGDNPLMKPLVYEVDRSLQSHLSNFLTEKVFVEDEDGTLPFSLCVFVCVWVGECMCVCVHSWVCVCAHECVCVCTCMCVFAHSTALILVCLNNFVGVKVWRMNMAFCLCVCVCVALIPVCLINLARKCLWRMQILVLCLSHCVCVDYSCL